MHRLVSHRLMFGNMILVESPVWVERYNRAMEHLTGKRTALGAFHIDISGFSPEIADEIGDDDYLNPNRARRQFILLTSQQASSPMLRGEFSFLREGLKAFIRQNEAAITTITSYDVMIGEIDDAAWRLAAPEDLARIKSVKITAQSHSGICGDANRAKALAGRFMDEPEGWLDDGLIEEMIALSKKSGGLIQEQMQIDPFLFRAENFYTPLFGGVYVIGSSVPKLMVFRDEKDGLPEIAGYEAISINESDRLFQTFLDAHLAERVIDAGPEALSGLRRRVDYALIAQLCDAGIAVPAHATSLDIRAIFAREGLERSSISRPLAMALRDAEHGDEPDAISVKTNAWPYLHRAVRGPAAYVVNAILSEKTPDDPATLFVLNKDAFYAQYASWGELRREAFSARIAQDYVAHKIRFREENFGGQMLRVSLPEA